LLVNGFNGLGLHTLLNIIRLFSGMFKNFVFVEIGIIDAGNFKGVLEISNLERKINKDTNHYVKFIRQNGYHAEAFTSAGIDIVDEIEKITHNVRLKYPNSIFFGGQIVFNKETFASRLLHNQVVFTVQKKLYQLGIPFLVMPIKLDG